MKVNPNPAGREGKPITLAGYSFDEAIQKALNTPPPKHEPKPLKRKAKPAKRKR
jgi:hypothetical protein